jgi:RNA polymerase sigma-32 factor
MPDDATDPTDQPQDQDLDQDQDQDLPPRPAPAPRAGDAGGLARYDPLRAYMAEVSRHPLLTREQEHELAVRYRETGDVQAAYTLVASNLRLVVKIAHEYRRTAFQLLDLIQEGNLGLMQAVKKYDPFKGVKLSSYAAWWIRAYIIRFLMENWRLVRLGTTQAQRKLFFNLSKEREKLIARGIDPTPRLLARNLDVEEHEVEEMAARMASDDLSLDAPARATDEGTATPLDRMASADAPAADVALGEEQLRRLFREQLEAFATTITDEKERYIFEHRLLPPEGQEPLTLQEVGDRWRLTRERARQIEARLTARLREHVRQTIPDFELLGPPAE